MRRNIKQANSLSNNGRIFDDLVKNMLCQEKRCYDGKFKLDDEPKKEVKMDKEGKAREVEVDGAKRKGLNRKGIEERFGIWLKLQEHAVENIENSDEVAYSQELELLSSLGRSV